MAKRKTLQKQEESSKKVLSVKIKKSAGFKRANPLKHLLDENFVMRAVWERISNNDPEGVLEILLAYIDAKKMAQKEQSEQSSILRSVRPVVHKHEPVPKKLKAMGNWFQRHLAESVSNNVTLRRQ